MNEILTYIEQSDNVIKTGANEYKTQCTQYARKFTLSELITYLLNEYKQF